MHGNVYEWCFDEYDEAAYGKRLGMTPDRIVTSDIEIRVFRGGSWYDTAEQSRTAFRGRDTPDGRTNCFGFRVVR